VPVRDTIPFLAKRRPDRLYSVLPHIDISCSSGFLSLSICHPYDRKKHNERIQLYLQIERLGIEMAPCTRCENSKKGSKCLALPESSRDSGRCSECARVGKTCDYRAKNKMPSVSDWESFGRKRQRLRDEEEEAMAKILRLRKQQRFLDEQEKKMVQAGLNSLDELDAQEAREKEEAEKKKRSSEDGQLRELMATGAPSNSNPDPSFGPIDVDPLLLADFDPSDPMWATLGFGGGTPTTTAGS